MARPTFSADVTAAYLAQPHREASLKDKTYPHFGVYVHRNCENDNPVLLTNFILDQWNRIEMCDGAHYYAHGEMGTKHTKAQITIPLPKLNTEVITKGRRTACISLSCAGEPGRSCDMGIENEGQGWFAHYWAAMEGPDGEAGKGSLRNNAVSVTITVEIDEKNTTKDKLTGKFIWTMSDGTTETDTLIYEKSANHLFYRENGRPKVRWTRFMSLILNNGIPKEPSYDYADGTKLVGRINNPRLFTSSDENKDRTGTPWGLGLLNYVWWAQTENISQCSVSTSDSFSCTHATNVYRDKK